MTLDDVLDGVLCPLEVPPPRLQRRLQPRSLAEALGTAHREPHADIRVDERRLPSVTEPAPRVTEPGVLGGRLLRAFGVPDSGRRTSREASVQCSQGKPVQRVRRAEQVQAAVWTHAAGLVPHEAALHDAQQRRDQGRGRAAAGPRAAPRAGRANPNPDPNPNPNPNANASSSPNPNPEQAEHFLAAVRQGEVEQVQRKLVERPELILVAAPGAPTRDPGRTMWYWSPLHLALQCVTPEAEGADRMVQVVAALLRHCEKNHILLSSLKRKSDSFATPLHEAACRGARAAIVVVRRHIASVDVSSGCNLTLRTALRLNMLFEYVLCVCVCVQATFAASRSCSP